MEKEAIDRYIRERYQNQLDWYDEKAIRNQMLSRCVKLGLIATSALTPVMLVSHFMEHVWWLAALALASAVATLLITGFMGAFQFEEHWLRYRSTCENLRSEFYVYQSGTDLYRDAHDKDALFVERVEEILSHERRSWRERTRNRKGGQAGH